MDTATLDWVTWATLDALNVENEQRYNTIPQYRDYPTICRAVEKARTRFNLFRDEFNAIQDGSVTASDVQEAENWYFLCMDAERYLWALHYGSHCSCTPCSGEMCKFCFLEKRYKEWKTASKVKS